MKIFRKLYTPAVVLFFLAPAIGELLSGSAPPAEFFNPFTLALLGVLYGGGAILVRELTFRWGKGWPSILLLGAAYGIAEEGLMVKSFFDPNWMDLGILGTYGRWAGVNWVWTFQLILYHAVFSIAIPILLVNLIFPEHRSHPWVSRRAFRWLAALFAGDILLGYAALTPYRPPFFPYLLAALAAFGLYRLARRLPHPLVPAGEGQPARARWFALAGFMAPVSLFFLSGALPNLGAPVLLTLALLATLPALAVWVIRRLTGPENRLPTRHLWALASGALGFFILLAPLQGMDATRTDNTSGMALVGLAAALLLAWIYRRIRKPAPAKPADTPLGAQQAPLTHI